MCTLSPVSICMFAFFDYFLRVIQYLTSASLCAPDFRHSKQNRPWSLSVSKVLYGGTALSVGQRHVARNVLLSCIIECTNSTFRNLTKQGICKTVSNRAEPTTFPMTISLFTAPRYTLTSVDTLICMPIPRMLF